jgi:hypothetical protein
VIRAPAVRKRADAGDAALVGFDRREVVTIPPLPDIDQWKTFSEARQAMLPNFRQEDAAARATSDVFHELRFP